MVLKVLGCEVNYNPASIYLLKVATLTPEQCVKSVQN